jgi:hypothetical protein
MKLRLSRTTMGFTLLGMTIALADIGLWIISAYSSPETQKRLWDVIEFFIYLCPASIGGMALANDPSRLHLIELWAVMVLSNMLIYFILGACCSFVLRKSLDWLDPPIAGN